MTEEQVATMLGVMLAAGGILFFLVVALACGCGKDIPHP